MHNDGNGFAPDREHLFSSWIRAGHCEQLWSVVDDKRGELLPSVRRQRLVVLVGRPNPPVAAQLLEDVEGVSRFPRSMPTAGAEPHNPFGVLKPRNAAPVVRVPDNSQRPCTTAGSKRIRSRCGSASRTPEGSDNSMPPLQFGERGVWRVLQVFSKASRCDSELMATDADERAQISAIALDHLKPFPG